MAIEMIENNELNPIPRTGNGFVNDITVAKVRWEGKDAFYSITGLAAIFGNKAASAKNATTAVRAKYGAEIKSCEQAMQLLAAVQLDMQKTQKQLTTVKKKTQRQPLENEYNALAAQESRIKQNLIRLNCDAQTDKQAEAEFTNTLVNITQSAASKPVAAGSNKTLIYAGIGVGVILVGGLVFYAVKS